MNTVSLLLGASLALCVPVAAIAKDAPAAAASIALKGKTYSIEIADDDATRQRGLMGRDSIPADHGMLFIFQDDTPRAFWMKNCKFPQDMLFFDAARKLVSVQHNVPACVADPCPA